MKKLVLAICLVCVATAHAASHVRKNAHQTGIKDPKIELNFQEDSDVEFNLYQNQVVIKREPRPRGQMRPKQPLLPPDTVMGELTFRL